MIEDFWEALAKAYSQLPEEEARKLLAESYYDGGVHMLQLAQAGPSRPTIPSFLKFAERYEGTPFRALYEFGGVEFALDYASDFENIGVEGSTLAACMDGDVDAIRVVCRKALQSMDNAREREKGGESQLASRGMTINPTAVKAFILATLDARERYQFHEVVPELYFLLGQIFFPGEPEAAKVNRQADKAAWAAMLGWAYYHKNGEYPSYRKLAKLMGVAPSTISRLFESFDQFERRAEAMGEGSWDPSEHPTTKDIYPLL